MRAEQMTSMKVCRSSTVRKGSVAAAVAALLAGGHAMAANQPCPPNVTANTSNNVTVASAACVVAAGVTVSTTGNKTASATLSGGTSASATTLTNNGTIRTTGTTSGRAIEASGTGAFLVINNNGTISTSNNDTVAAGTGSTSVNSVSLVNTGSILSAAGGQAVNFNKITGTSTPNSVTNSGLIQATGSDAVRPGVNGTVSNSGTIHSIDAVGSGSDGVDAQTNTGVGISNAANAGSGSGTGLIEGARHGITGGNTKTTVNNGAYAMSITNNLGGTIRGDDGSGINIDGINGNELVTIVNHGTITGNGVSGDGDAVDVDGLVNLTNTGTLHSLNAFASTGHEFSEGVTVGGGTIVNSGTIQGSVAAGNLAALGRGITIAGVDKDSSGNAIPVQAPYAATTITNSGLIRGDSDSGIIFSSALSSGFTHTINNNAGGRIQTGSSTAAAIVTAADNVLINNAGMIDGSSSGKAIQGGPGAITLTVTGGSASILGDIAGGTGTNRATLNPGDGNSFAYSGSISNFSNVEVLSGHVTLSGANSYTGTTRITGGTLTLQGAHRLSTTSSLDLASGTLQLLNAGGADGQHFASLALSATSTLDLGSSSMTFDQLSSVTSGSKLSILDWSASTSANYAIRFLGDDSSNSLFLALISGTTVDGLKATYSFDGTYTNVSAVPIPAAALLLLSGLGLLAGTRGRNGALTGVPGA